MIGAMWTRNGLGAGILTIMVTCGGCLAPKRAESTYVTSRPVSAGAASPEADRLWEGIQESLHRRGFKLDRVDRRAGVITAWPVTSQQFFEIWRHDVDTREDFWEATLNPFRRMVEVHVARADDGAWRELAVVVRKQRYSAPDRQFNSTGAAYEYFGTALPTTAGETQIGTERDRWLDVGRDPAMEAYLLTRIMEDSGIPDTAEASPTVEPGA